MTVSKPIPARWWQLIRSMDRPPGRHLGGGPGNLENSRYNWNELNGLGVVMGQATAKLPTGSERELVLQNQQLLVLRLRADGRCPKPSGCLDTC